MKRTENLTIGLEVLADRGHVLLDHSAVGLLANSASVDSEINHAWRIIDHRWPGQIQALLTPQHGFWGDAQANMIETDHSWHRALEVPIFSLYSETRRPTEEMLDSIDCLVVDLQDVGTRIYTFAWTLLECMQACASTNTSMLILDRPNPVGGQIIEGPLLQEGFKSFVGGATIPMRHGLTMAELAQLFQKEECLDLEWDVVSMRGWSSDWTWSELKRIWVPPSPNLPTDHSTQMYPGQVLLEGTNLSEGRGTTIPFQVIGAPFIDSEWLADELTKTLDESVRFLPTYFRPSFDKWANQQCGGVCLYVTDPSRFRPFRVTIQILEVVQRLYPSEFGWLDPPYEYETDKPPIDILYGSDRLRCQLGRLDSDALSRVTDLDEWRERVSPALLYSDASRFLE